MRAAKDTQRQRLRHTLPAAGALLLAFTMTALPGSAAAQQVLEDRLECFKLRTRDTTWTANAHAADVLELVFPAGLTPPFPAGESGVELLSGAQAEPSELCVPVLKDPSRPPLGNGIAGALACYDLRDHRVPRTEVALADEYGSGTVVVREGTRKLCVPVAIP